MTDPFVPEADRLEQEQEVIPDPVPADDEAGATPALEYPMGVPFEASEGDFLEQTQSIDLDDEEGGR